MINSSVGYYFPFKLKPVGKDISEKLFVAFIVTAVVFYNCILKLFKGRPFYEFLFPRLFSVGQICVVIVVYPAL